MGGGGVRLRTARARAKGSRVVSHTLFDASLWTWLAEWREAGAEERGAYRTLSAVGELSVLGYEG